jgi:probable rRNA maturation factor
MSSPEGSSILFRRVAADLRPRSLENFAGKLQRELARGRAFDCLITGDAELRKLNREFRGKDQPTDVLSFPNAAHPGKSSPLGSIAISAARARAQARALRHSTDAEIRILMLHGVLHLLGYDHETDAGRMARAEKRWRKRLALPVGLIERVAA